ncbi:MAG: D-alanyl-D-alanine carboxypeptidase [Clostridia bacterium]|nr:D-alanyl-D-alanine carboxypeptidase [Clostridia bacterium]
MKKRVYFLILPIILSIFLIYNNSYSTSAYTVSHGECVIEVNSGRILYETASNVKLPMASTTKILTALTVIENFDVNKEITVPKKCVGIEGSSVYLREGEKLTVKELLYGLMLRSGNDCAECLASCLISRDEFIKLMNKTAKNCGAKNSNFVNPHGLPDDNHYTTAYDLAKISVKAIKNPIFKEIVSTKRVNISNDGYPYDRLLVNKNKLLFSYDGCTGIKTGYTKKAGRCLVTSAERNGMEVVSVVIDSPQMWERTKELLDSSFTEYQMTKIINLDYYQEKVYTDGNGNAFLLGFNNDFSYPIKNSEKDKINFKFDGKTESEFITNPQKECVFEIFIENKLIFSQNLYNIV